MNNQILDTILPKLCDLSTLIDQNNTKYQDKIEGICQRIHSLENKINLILTNQDQIENKLNCIISQNVAENGTGKTVPTTKRATPTKQAINVRWKDMIGDIEGATLVRQMLESPGEEWKQKRDKGTIVKYNNDKARITNYKKKDGTIQIELLGSIQGDNITKITMYPTPIPVTVKSEEIEVLPLWPFEPLEKVFKTYLPKCPKEEKKIKNGTMNEKIVAQGTILWTKVLKEEKYKSQLEWLKKYIDEKTLDGKISKSQPKLTSSTSGARKPPVDSDSNKSRESDPDS